MKTKKNLQWLFVQIYFLFLSVLNGLAQQSPDILYHKLFQDVQINYVFKDSKTFVDCQPLFPVDSILSDYSVQQNIPGFNLYEFICTHFKLPDTTSSGFISDTIRPVRQHIDTLWDILTHRPDMNLNGKRKMANGSLIPLPHPYIVPGGRFREIYYWDSYFTMLGLKASDKPDLIGQMVDNFAYLIQQYGFVPNGNRSYYLSRSQPPFFSLMIRLVMDINCDSLLLKYLPSLEKEYLFWMDGADKLCPALPAYKHVVMLPGNFVLNRYWDNDSSPRPESYREDARLAQTSPGTPGKMYRNIRAACESGWDFSSRWFKDEKSIQTIHTTDIIPVDLNALLYHLEIMLEKGYHMDGNTKKEEEFRKKAGNRKKAIHLFCWNDRRHFFMDYDFTIQKNTNIYSLAGMFPLYFKIATNAQAKKVASVIEKNFFYPGGLVTTLIHSGQQWDAPNGWAPLQWISIIGLRNYRLNVLAEEIKNKWVANNIRVFKLSGKLMEKYNVEDIELPSGGGEYKTQDGFGWTNGVLIQLLKE